MRNRAIITLAALAAAAACTHPVDTANAPTFGASVAAMYDAQVVSQTAQPGAPEGSGAVGALAQERYKQGATRPLLPASTSTNNPGR
jgi:hypothetical protein